MMFALCARKKYFSTRLFAVCSQSGPKAQVAEHQAGPIEIDE